MEHTNGKLELFHSPSKDAELQNAHGNANYLGFVPKGLKVVAQIANTRESTFGVEAQNANVYHIAKCWNMFDEMLAFIEILENENFVMPEFLQKERKRIIKKSKGETQ